MINFAIFLFSFLLSVLVTSILIKKNNKINDKYDAVSLYYKQRNKKYIRNNEIYVPPQLAVRLISKYCHAPDGIGINDFLFAEALLHIY